jgi:hypothetical protein
MEALALFLANQHPSVIVCILFALMGSPLAVTMIVLWTWIKDRHRQAETDKRQAAVIETYRVDMQTVLKSYGDHVSELSAYYEKNVELVKSWQNIAEGFRDTVVLNTQMLTKVCDLVETNQYCPGVRVGKR